MVTPEDTGAAEAKLLLQKVTAMENLLVGIVYEAGGRVNYMFGHSDGVNADCANTAKKQTKFLTGAAAVSPILRRQRQQHGGLAAKSTYFIDVKMAIEYFKQVN